MKLLDPPFLDGIKHKIHTWESLATTVRDWKEKGERIVFTNGCFDLIHYGHIYYLAEARALGDRLIVGMNATKSVQRLKGKHRPIKSEESRLFVMASFSFVDALTVFEQDTPKALIQSIVPDILVKGGDWPVDQIVGADIVLANGGQVKNLSFVDGYSTTRLEQKIIAHFR